jgi:hypothetical protein
MTKSKNPPFQILAILLGPVALFWVLYRYGFYILIDTVAVGILAATGLIFGLKYLFQKKIFKFG